LPSHSKIPAAVLDSAVKEILAAAKDPKTKRRFLESVELQIGLKNLDPAVRSFGLPSFIYYLGGCPMCEVVEVMEADSNFGMPLCTFLLRPMAVSWLWYVRCCAMMVDMWLS